MPGKTREGEKEKERDQPDEEKSSGSGVRMKKRPRVRENDQKRWKMGEKEPRRDGKSSPKSIITRDIKSANFKIACDLKFLGFKISVAIITNGTEWDQINNVRKPGMSNEKSRNVTKYVTRNVIVSRGL
ncbi:MAG: hypothetical protein J5546_07055 [Lachnospiraceae bacterium]|nr:hypothetical protein [Lachnospiraceae bacterium]